MEVDLSFKKTATVKQKFMQSNIGSRDSQVDVLRVIINNIIMIFILDLLV